MCRGVSWDAGEAESVCGRSVRVLCLVGSGIVLEERGDQGNQSGGEFSIVVIFISLMREAGITVSGHYTINASEAASLANWQGSSAEQLQALDAQLQPEQTWFGNNDVNQGANGGGGGVRCIKPDWLMRFTGRNPLRGCMSKEPMGNELVLDNKVIASVKKYAKLQVFRRQRKDQNDPSLVTVQRQNRVPKDYLKHAQKIDRELLGLPPDAKGPFEQALEVRGEAVGVVSGVMGECSPSVDKIVHYVARTVARSTKETSKAAEASLSWEPQSGTKTSCMRLWVAKRMKSWPPSAARPPN